MDALLGRHEGSSIFGDASTGPDAYPWLALDIETGNPPDDVVERWVRHFKRPPANYKAPKAIEEWYEEQIAKQTAKAAVLGAAPIFMVSLKSPTELRCLHCLEHRPPRLVHGGLVEGFATRAEMLAALRILLDARCTPETVLVGHNVLKFDLPRLRLAYARERVTPPAILFPSSEFSVFDTMDKASRYFALGDDSPFVKLSHVLEWMGIPSHKDLVDGSMVPTMIAEGAFDDLERYSLLDALAEAELYLRMTGQIDDAPAGAEVAA
jgi:hypothetical protein